MNFKTSIFSVFVILFVLATANLSEAFATVAVTPTADANTLANALAGPGVTIVPASPILTGGTTAGSECSGTFTGGASAGIGIPSGIILTSGFASNAAVTPNTDDDITGVTGGGADADLDALIGGGPTFDKCVLEFYITTSTGDLFFNYAFASDEYNEFVFSFNDVFGLFVDGTNIALAPPPAAPGTPVSINNVNGGNPFGALNAVNPTLYNNNDPTDGGPFVSLQYDGYTNTFTASKIGIGLGTHHVKLAIADAFDLVLDSAVFIQEGSFTGIDTTPPVAVSAKIIGPTQAQIVYSENAVVTGEAISGNYDFLVVAGEPRIIDSISGSGTATHTLTFSGGSAVNTDATGFVTINLSGGETVEDSAGNAIASDTLQPLTDGQAPATVSAKIIGPTQAQIVYSENAVVTGEAISGNYDFLVVAGEPRIIDSISGSGTATHTLTFSGGSAVNTDATGFVTINLSGGETVEDSAGNAIASDTLQPLTDGQAPATVSAKIIGPTQAQIVYSENAVVTGEAISGNYDFLVVAGEPRIIDSISGSGTATHTLTFSGGSAVNTDATGFVTINLSGGETVEDSAGNAIASDTLQPLTDGQAPATVSAKIIGPTQAQIVYSENAVVTGEAISGNYDFLVVAGEPRIIDSISGSGTATHTLTFSGGSAVNTDATGFVTINLSGGETVEDSAGNAIASDTLQPLTDGQEPIPTSVILDPITDPYTDDKFTVTGKLINDNTGRGIAGKIVKFDGTGTGNVPADVPGNVEGPPDATTSSFTVNDSPGIEIDDSTGDNILRLNEGATIDFPSNPPQVILLLSDMGFATFDVQVTTLGFPTSFTATGVGQDSDVGAFILTDADGISSIEITDISDGTAGITRVEAFNSQLVRYIDEEFDDAASGPSPQSFAEGSFFSIGTAQSTFTTTELTVDAHFDGDESYDPSASEPCGEEEECTPTNIQTYNVLFTTAAGFGGAVPFISSNGGGFTNTFDCPDPDGDSLCTSWETTGIPVAGEPNLMLPGADPQKKNIYVEVDYFTGRSPFDIPPGYTTTPMDDVRTAFANAPVSNPTPSTNGIILTVEQGQQITQSVPVLNVWTDTDASTCNDFDCLKALYFGNPGDSVARKNARAQAYHYFIFANSLPGGSSGIAEVGQNDGVVALGGAGFNENQNQQVSGTFMHELGHNLNLDHGGPANVNYQDRSINCKPNHDSVMSYSRQLPNLLSLPSEWRLDYSDGGLSPNSSPSSTLNFLKESGGTPSNPGNIAESNGNLYHHDNPRRIDPEAVPWLIWGTPSLGSAVGLSSPAPQTYLKQQARAAGVSNNVDWNGNGVATDPGTHLKRDLNGFGFYGCESGSFSTYRLKNYDEWNELNYNFRGLPGGSYDAARPFDNSYSLAVPDIDAQI